MKQQYLKDKENAKAAKKIRISERKVIILESNSIL
jgi:hypothetical protein